MTNVKYFFSILLLGLIACSTSGKGSKIKSSKDYSNIKIVGAMKNVMWNGELAGNIQLDTISDKEGLYGLGPLSYLKGELLINNGESYVSKVISDTTMSVVKSFNVSSPFFVYTNETEWEENTLPVKVKNIKQLERYINEKTSKNNRPFVFKLKGKIDRAIIHIQNLPKGTKVSSPKEAHQGQTNYILENDTVEIVGFFSTEHQGVFTHHDSYLHMHLITFDESKMGHLDKIEINEMKIYLPKR